MHSKQPNFNLPFLSMASTDDNFGRLKPSSPKKMKTMTLFEDLLDNPDSENLHSKTNNLEDQGQESSSPSDYENGVSETGNDPKHWLSNGLIRVPEGDKMYEIIKDKLVSGLISSGIDDARLETIYKNGYSSTMSRAKLHSFGIYSRAIQAKCGGVSNVKYAWYGACKHKIGEIISHGFGVPLNSGVYGYGVCLSTIDHPIESLQSSTADEDGLRHLLLCRVILGNVEVINPGSGQSNPSSEEFDTGVDDLVSPKKYIVWNSEVNTHILPEFVVSFRTSSYCCGCHKMLQHPRLPNSDWMPLGTLINALSEFIPADAFQLLSDYHRDYKKRKITRREMIQRVRHAVGDKLLIAMIKSYMGKIGASGSRTTQPAK